MFKRERKARGRHFLFWDNKGFTDIICENELWYNLYRPWQISWGGLPLFHFRRFLSLFLPTTLENVPTIRTRFDLNQQTNKYWDSLIYLCLELNNLSNFVGRIRHTFNWYYITDIIIIIIMIRATNKTNFFMKIFKVWIELLTDQSIGSKTRINYKKTMFW